MKQKQKEALLRAMENCHSDFPQCHVEGAYCTRALCEVICGSREEETLKIAGMTQSMKGKRPCLHTHTRVVISVLLPLYNFLASELQEQLEQ